MGLLIELVPYTLCMILKRVWTVTAKRCNNAKQWQMGTIRVNYWRTEHVGGRRIITRMVYFP